jgi:hypothetical protein
VLDASDVPVVGAPVFATASDERMQRGAEDQYRAGYTTTGADGRFTLTHVQPGATQLTAFHTTAPPAIDGPFEVVAGAEVARTVRFGSGAVLEGRVLSATGTSVASAMVSIYELDAAGRGLSPRRTARTDSAGGFRFEGLTTARYRVTRLHSDDDFPVTQLETTVDVSSERVTTVLLQPTGDGSIEGQVFLPDGEPVPRVLVLATFQPPQGAPPAFVPPVQVRGAIARAGKFRLEDLDRGRWSVRATHYRDESASTATAEVVIEGTRSVPLDLRLQ